MMMNALSSRLSPVPRLWKTLRDDRSGIALVEFAFALPLFMGLGLYGAELANYATIKMNVSQTALTVADNASRIGENGVLQNIRIYESDINDLFVGADYSNTKLDLAHNGRIILSSLTRNGDDGQWIQWQRCIGDLDHASSYGDTNDGETGTNFPGMGPSDNPITAASDTAVMFVEVAYRYQPLFTNVWIPGPEIITAIGAFNVRDDRDLSQIYTESGVTASSCA